jgi:hypothetical protein
MNKSVRHLLSTQTIIRGAVTLYIIQRTDIAIIVILMLLMHQTKSVHCIHKWRANIKVRRRTLQHNVFYYMRWIDCSMLELIFCYKQL